MKRHVALIVETSSTYGRDLLSGIVRFMRMHDQWSVFLEQRDLWKQPPAWLNDWQGDGIISRATTPRLLEAIATTGVPLVEVTDRRGDVDLPQVRSDDAAIGHVGAEYLIERGFQQFGFCGFRGEAWSQRREDAFAESVERNGIDCSRYNSAWHGRAARSWEDEQQAIMEWLGGMTPPFAIEDRDVASALHYIRAHACRGLTVDEVVTHNPVSRSTLERQVRKYLGRTPQEEIRRVQVNRVKELLLATELSAEKIAGLCGFEHPEYLHVVFKRLTGMTPGEFRRSSKPTRSSLAT